MTPTAILQQIAQAVPTAQSDAFTIKDLLTFILPALVAVAVTLLSRSWSHQSTDSDRIWRKIDDIEKAILRTELHIVEIQGYVEPIKEAVRLSIAGMVPRANPLSDQTNEAVMLWHHGAKLPPEIMLEAAKELIREAAADPKLSEAERMMFNVTAASMNYEATKMLTQRRRIREGLV